MCDGCCMHGNLNSINNYQRDQSKLAAVQWIQFDIACGQII